MNGKKYRLQTVLDIRGRAREEAAKNVALRLEQLAKTEAELKRRQKLLQNCYERQSAAQKAMQEDLIQGTQTQHILGHKIFLNDLKNLENEILGAIEEQKKTVAKAEREVESAREKLLESAKDLKVIEVHRENWSNTEKIAAERRTQKISDEIGSIIYNRREKK